ncbi:MAG: enoyl-CoA hydratase-related protein, partial [Pseudomonadota bacterium]
MDTRAPLAPSSNVVIEDKGAVRRIVLNRPQQRNLLTFEMIDALSAAFDAPAMRVIVIAAEGPAFCVGHDMKSMSQHHGDGDGGRDYFQRLFAHCGAMMEKIATLPQPVIAEVHAPAVAAGCQLVAACDLAIAADTARFGTTGVAFGLYCSTPAVPLMRTVAAKHAAEMLMTGDLVDAAHAARVGLINRAVSPEVLTDETMALAERIASHSPAVVALGKQTAAQTRTLPLHEAYACAGNAMVDNLLLADGREGLDAFVNKRAATWRNLPDDKKTRWDERYKTHDAPFGTLPNQTLADNINALPKGRAFVAADGQGRNAIFLARAGFDVTMNDLSETAVETAQARAAEAGVIMKAEAGNLLTTPPAPGAYDVVAAFFLHLDPAARRQVHESLAAALAPGGVLIIEAFSKAQEA